MQIFVTAEINVKTKKIIWSVKKRPTTKTTKQVVITEGSANIEDLSVLCKVNQLLSNIVSDEVSRVEVLEKPVTLERVGAFEKPAIYERVALREKSEL